MIKEELDFLIQQGEGYNLEDIYFGISFERPDLQTMSIEQRINEYNMVGDKLGDNQRKIIDMMRNKRNITIPELSEELNISTTAIENNLAKLKEVGFIRRIGPDRGGYWEVIN